MRIGIYDDEISFHHKLKIAIDKYAASKAILVKSKGNKTSQKVYKQK